MFTRNVGRAVKLATLVAVVAAAPIVAAAQGAAGSSGSSGGSEPYGGMGAGGAKRSSGGTGSSAATSGQMPPSPAAMQKMKANELYNMMDKDKDGYVTKDEFLKFQERVFDSWDKNHSGRISQAMFNDQG